MAHLKCQTRTSYFTSEQSSARACNKVHNSQHITKMAQIYARRRRRNADEHVIGLVVNIWKNFWTIYKKYRIFSLTYRRLWQQQRIIRDPFAELTELEFVRNFRLSKEICLHLIDQIKPMLDEEERSTAILREIKILCALRFFATGKHIINHLYYFY